VRTQIDQGRPIGSEDSIGRSKPVLPTPRQSTTRASTARDTSITESDNDEYTSPAEAESESEFESEDEEDDNDQRVPLVAVTRGLTLLKDPPASTTSTVKPKHRFNTGTDFEFKAVLRGQIVSEQESDVEWIWVEKKGMTPKKRGQETEVEHRGQEHKKAKVEAEP
jgi:hypothetical protein